MTLEASHKDGLGVRQVLVGHAGTIGHRWVFDDDAVCAIKVALLRQVCAVRTVKVALLRQVRTVCTVKLALLHKIHGFSAINLALLGRGHLAPAEEAEATEGKEWKGRTKRPH